MLFFPVPPTTIITSNQYQLFGPSNSFSEARLRAVPFDGTSFTDTVEVVAVDPFSINVIPNDPVIAPRAATNVVAKKPVVTPITITLGSLSMKLEM